MRNDDYINKATSEKLGIDVKIVKEVRAFYWKTVRKNISNADYNSIFLKNLGTITMSRKKLRTEISALIRAIKKMSTDENMGVGKKAILEDKIKSLHILLKRRNELAIFYFENKRKWNKPK